MQYLADAGLESELTVLHTPQQNGISERTIQTVVNIANCLIYYASAHPPYWAEAVVTAAYIKNTLLTRSITGAKSGEQLCRAKPDLWHLRIWGCTAYEKVLLTAAKFMPNAEKWIFLGYSLTSKNYKIYILSTRWVVFSRNVIFEESWMFFGGGGKKGDADQTDSTRPTSEERDDSVFSRRIASLVSGITELPDSDSEIDNPGIQPEEMSTLEARTPDTRTPEMTLTLGTVPANLQFAGGPVQVDLSAGRQTHSQVAVTAEVPACDDTRVAAVVLTGDDTDKNFTFMVTNGPSLLDALQQGDALKWQLSIDSEVASLQHYWVFHQVVTNQSGKVIPTKIILI